MVKEDAIYARQSVDRNDSISIESQIEYCIYETRGKPYRVYQDKGFSGKNTDRPEFQEMLAAIRRNEIRRVICYKLDRCSRSILDFANLMDELQRYKVEFVSCTEKFDTSTPMGRAMLNICIVFAQLERETIQQRVADAYHSRSQRGFYMGGRIPYAYRLEPYIIQGKKTSRYSVCQEEAQILLQIYRIYCHPQASVGEVMRYLNENGIVNSRTRDGKWSKSYLSSILKNPIYVKADLDVYSFFKNHGTNILNPPEDFIGTNGCYLYKNTEGRRKELVLEGHSLVIAPHQGVIPSDLWLKCRKKSLNNRQFSKPTTARHTWLAGKIKCPHCGYALVIKKDRYNRYYMCSRHLTDKGSCKGVGALKAGDVESIILDAVKRNINELEPLRSRIMCRDSPRITDLKLRITKIQDEINAYLASMMASNSTVTAYINTKVAELDEKKRECLRELEQLEYRECYCSSEQREINNCMSLWDKLDHRDKVSVMDALIFSIEASKDRISIRWKL